MVNPGRLTTGDVACWVIKSRIPPHDIVPGWTRGTSQELTRCLRRSYRVELMQPGQPCLLWLSGRADPGVQAVGTLMTCAEVPEGSDPDAPELAITAQFHLLSDPVPRASWLSDLALSGSEVIRMPAGSNPSYLGRERWRVLRTLISPRDESRAGW